MIEIEIPKVENVAKGNALKVLKVTGTVGMHMPEHHSTLEGVLVVIKGKAILTLNKENSLLQKDEIFIIPAGERHSLSVVEDFEALVTMPIASSIEF